MSDLLLIALAPKVVFDKAKKLRAEGDYKGALRILENNMVEFEVNEANETVSAKVVREPKHKVRRGFKKDNKYTEYGHSRWKRNIDLG